VGTIVWLAGSKLFSEM